MRIGIVGYSGQKFEEAKADALLYNSLVDLLGCETGSTCSDLQEYDRTNLVIVSGLTAIGIPLLAYRLAKSYGIETMGIACSKASEYDCFPCDRVHIVGSEWGDESEAFLASIDALIRIGGGKQSLAECARAKELGMVVIEKDLASTQELTCTN